MRLNIALIVVLLLSNYKIYSKSKGVAFNATSSFIVQIDSFSTKYLNAKKLYEKEEYSSSLRLSLSLIEGNNTLKTEEIILANQLIAKIFFATRNNRNAIKYYKKTLNYLNNYSKDKTAFDSKKNIDFKYNDIIAESYLDLGSSYYRLNNINELKKDKDSALHFYNEVDNLNVINDNVFQVKSRAYTNLSVIFMNDSLYDKAKYYANKAISIHKKLGNKVNQAAALGNLSSINLSESNFKEAKRIYFEALDLIRNEKSNEALIVREKLYFNLAYNLYILKDYKAYDYQELSYSLKDTLRQKEFKGIIDEINAEYNFNVKKNLLLKEEENKRLKDQRIFWVIGIVSIIIILSLLFWLNYYKLKQKNLGLKLSQSQLIQNQNIEKIRSESQARILNATIDGKESERKQIAETLHDSVSALLSSANLHLQATRSQFNGKTPIEIDKTQEIITEASQKIRDLSHTLVSSVLLKFGLEYAVKDIADKYSNSQITIDTEIGETRRYHQNFEIKVYNIIQEFVNNILKHSNAKSAMIEIAEIEGKLSIKIADDGIGFDKTLITNKDGLGLNQIEARIQMMQGDFLIDSVKNNGTVIHVVLPILEKEEINLV